MVDRIPKINLHEHLRVDEPQEALDDEEERTSDGEESSAEEVLEGDDFDQAEKREDWNHLAQPVLQNQRQVTFLENEIQEMRFLKIDLKTNPSLLNIKVLMKDGSVYASVYVSIPRTVAVPLQHHKMGMPLEVSDMTDANFFYGFISETKSPDQWPRPETVPVEKTLSRTIKMWVRKTWAERMGLQDPDTHRTNTEIAWVYVTVFTVTGAIIFAVWWMTR